MGGGLLQLAAKNTLQGTYLVENPQMSFFRHKFYRHTNFAIDTLRQDFEEDPAYGSRCHAIIGRRGDLVREIILEVTMTRAPNVYPTARGGYHPAEALVEEVTLTIGGMVIDRLTMDWMRIYDALHRSADQSAAYARLTNFDATTLCTDRPSTETLYLPLQFFFSRNPSLALPLISLPFSEVRLSFDFARAEDIGVLPDANFSACLQVEYIYCDTPEREYFSRTPLTYLIEQVQHLTRTLDSNEGPGTNSMRTVRVPLNFSRPVKAMYWIFRETGTDDAMTSHGRYVGDLGGTYLSYQTGFDGGHTLMQSISERLAPLFSARLMFNGVDRFSHEGSYFNRVQPYQYARCTPLPGIYMYSFALDPNDPYPSGEANFSTIDADLVVTFKKSVATSIYDFPAEDAERIAKNITGLLDMRVFAWSYNILRIERGTCGLLLGN